MTHPDGIARKSIPLVLAGLLGFSPLPGCGHTEPYDPGTVHTDQPFDPNPPVRLTLNRAADRDPAWLPDGSAILYSTQPLGRQDNDVCLALLPATGGSQRALTCNLSPDPNSLTEALESPAPLPDGRIAFVAAASHIGAVSPDNQSIALAGMTDLTARQILRPLPYTIPGGRLHGGVSQLHWLSTNRLVYLAEAVHIIRACQLCPRDTVRSGLEAVWLDASLPGAMPHVIPGTDYASGVSSGGSEDEIYYTLAGDSRVYHQVLSTGAISVVHDFGGAGITRDVHVVGNRMTAVVGGRVHFAGDSLLGPTQWDSGGVVHVVDLQQGTMEAIEGPGLFRRPRLSPLASAIIAESYPLVLTPVLGTSGIDTTVSELGDLYLFGQP